MELTHRLLLGALIGYLGGAMGALLLARLVRWERAANLVGFGAALAGSAAALAAALVRLFGPGTLPDLSFELFPSPNPLLHLAVRLDPLSAFFLLILGVLGVAIALYSWGYAPGYYGRKSVGVLGFFFNALLLATMLVICAANAFFFLLAWELMALCAYCLVSFEHEQLETRRAGILFFVMSHLGTGCVMLGFLLLFHGTGQLEFARFHELGPGLAPGLRNAAFVLFLAGFGVKAGIVPLHIWLPAAHPVAPSNVSALLSGMIIKTGIYGLARVWFDFLGAPPLWWGVVVLIIGTASALLGVLYALMEHDLKRLLAYHSIENIGIILIGFGAALLFLATHQPALAALAIIAGLYHTLNHATFKALLFLGAGAVVHGAHTRNMEELGGLIRRMPRTAFLFLVGAVAIAGLPPLNGFVSEWLTYQSLLRGFGITQNLVLLLFPISGALLALTAALAAACFVKAFGITFLAQPRSEHARHAREAAPTMVLGMALLALVCFGLGLFPTLFLKTFDPVTAQLLGQPLSAQLTVASPWAVTALTPAAGSIAPLGLTALLVGLLPLPLVLAWVGRRGRPTRRGPTWDCGLRGLTPRMEYTATAFSKPLQMVFRALFRPRREMQTDYEFSRYFTRTIRFEVHIEPIFERWIYQPFQSGVLKLSKRIRALQMGSVHAYLAYVFITLLVLLLLARWL